MTSDYLKGFKAGRQAAVEVTRSFGDDERKDSWDGSFDMIANAIEQIPMPKEVFAQHVCDHRCLSESGHHAWPSPLKEE